MELFCGPFCVVKFCVCVWMCMDVWNCVDVFLFWLFFVRLHYTTLGSAFKDVLFVHLLGEMIPFD